MKKADSVEVVETKGRKFSIDYYLRESKLSDPLKQMMKDLFHGQNHTMEEWKKIDDNTNKRRC